MKDIAASQKTVTLTTDLVIDIKDSIAFLKQTNKKLIILAIEFAGDLEAEP